MHRDHILKTNSIQSNFLELPASTVISICNDLMNGESILYLADKYELPTYVINDIKGKHSYKYITDNYNFPELMHILTNDEVIKVCELLDDGYTGTEVANITNISRSSIYDIKNGVYHRDISSKYNFSERW